MNGLLPPLLLACCAVGFLGSEATAAPITFNYSGTVTQSFDVATVPLGTPATFQISVDPNADFAEPPMFADNVGGYLGTMTVQFLGMTYVGTVAFEVNQDLAFGVPQPGHVLVRSLSWTGPLINGSFPTALCSPFNPIPCADELLGVADPLSDALPVPFDPITARVRFANLSPNPSISVTGTLVQVPEPSVIAMVLLAAAAGIARSRSRRSEDL
jgi:hypothetical protein